MLGKTSDPLLQQVEEAIQQNVKPQDQVAFQKIVTAGLRVMYDPKTHALMVKQLQKPGDPAELAGEGVAALIALLYRQSKNTMPIPPAIMAAQILLCEALDFMQQAGQVKVDADLVAGATKSLMAHIMQIFGVDPSQLNQAAKAQQNAAGQPGIIAGAQQ